MSVLCRSRIHSTVCQSGSELFILSRAPSSSKNAIDAPVWSFINGSSANGIQYRLKNGESSSCSSDRVSIVQFICADGDVSTMDPVVENPTCTYTTTIHTEFACTPASSIATATGLLEGLAGIWVGTGINIVALPDFDNPAGPKPFRVKASQTIETLTFTPIGSNVPNRGSVTAFGATTGQNDSSSTECNTYSESPMQQRAYVAP